MLLPSALPCDFLAPSLARTPYHSPPVEAISASSTVMQTCRRLQQMLSSTPAPLTTSALPKRRVAARSEAPRTPLRRANHNIARLPAPRGVNKRTRTTYEHQLPTSPVSDKEQQPRDLFATPQRKRVRMSTPPPPPNRGFPLRQQAPESDDDDLEIMDWTDDDDRQLVEMVLGRLQLSKSDWEECARSLGKGDSRSVGKRWENLVGAIGVKNRRKRILKAKGPRRA
ncbi:hypothetical protein BZA77DRAFT_124760 [Pyronema omphalodes]|nr:hypothetical protein BZA77DRAFT_124760 [Pyronema omphalodes]